MTASSRARSKGAVAIRCHSIVARLSAHYQSALRQIKNQDGATIEKTTEAGKKGLCRLTEKAA
jgi:hypothetical protein